MIMVACPVVVAVMAVGVGVAAAGWGVAGVVGVSPLQAYPPVGVWLLRPLPLAWRLRSRVVRRLAPLVQSLRLLGVQRLVPVVW